MELANNRYNPKGIDTYQRRNARPPGLKTHTFPEHPINHNYP